MEEKIPCSLYIPREVMSRNAVPNYVNAAKNLVAGMTGLD